MFLIKLAIFIYVFQLGFVIIRFMSDEYKTKEEFKKEISPMFWVKFCIERYKKLK